MSEEMSSDDELEAANEVGMSLEEFIEHVRVKGRLLLLLVTFSLVFFTYISPIFLAFCHLYF